MFGIAKVIKPVGSSALISVPDSGTELIRFIYVCFVGMR